MKISLLVLLVILVGCDPVTRTRPVGESKIVTVEESCTHFSYCFTCMPGFDGKNECGYKASSLCPGNQKVQISITPMELTRKSGKTEIEQQRRTIKEITACE
jgi:hypothetical protein